MRRSKAFVAGVAFVLVFGIALWFATMPYPIPFWWEAHFLAVENSNGWPVSDPDIAMAKRLVAKECKWREIVTKVRVTGPNAIEVKTTARWSNNPSGSFDGHYFIVEKVEGEWKVVTRKMWVGMF